MRKVGLVLLVATCILALAQGQGSPEEVDVQVQSSADFGTFLVDGMGRSLYAFENDSADSVACSADCLSAWPAATIDREPVAGKGVAASLLGTITREDGTVQLTYAGHPLYYFVDDSAPGETSGHGVIAFGGMWHLVSPYGSFVEVPEPAEEAEVSDAEQAEDENEQVPTTRAELLEVGETVFAANCAVCHGAQGEGFTGPQLAGNDRLRDKQYVVGQILAGSGGMPPFAASLSESQIAAVATFIRGSWGNQFGTVTSGEVEALAH